MRALAYAIEHLLFPLIVAALLLSLLRHAPGGPLAYADQIDRWIGLDQVARVFDGWR